LQAPLEGPHGSLLPCGSANQAWLSVDLVEVLCHMAEIGHGSVVHALLEFPIKHCPEILLIVVAQVKVKCKVLILFFPLEVVLCLLSTLLLYGD